MWSIKRSSASGHHSGEPDAEEKKPLANLRIGRSSAYPDVTLL
jgi:hypothetical protein